MRISIFLSNLSKKKVFFSLKNSSTDIFVYNPQKNIYKSLSEENILHIMHVYVLHKLLSGK